MHLLQEYVEYGKDKKDRGLSLLTIHKLYIGKFLTVEPHLKTTIELRPPSE